MITINLILIALSIIIMVDRYNAINSIWKQFISLIIHKDEKLIKDLKPPFSCSKCLIFWFSLLFGLFHMDTFENNYIIIIAISLLNSYLIPTYNLLMDIIFEGINKLLYNIIKRLEK